MSRGVQRSQYIHDLTSAPGGAVWSMCSAIFGRMRCAQSALFCCMVYSEGPAGVAVRHSGAVLEGCVGVRVAGLAELVLEQVNGVVQEVGVSVTYRKMQLAFELWPERGPIALENCGEIVVIMPVGERGFVDFSGERVDDFGGVTVGSGGREDGLPDIPLLGGASMGSEHVFVCEFGAGVAR